MPNDVLTGQDPENLLPPRPPAPPLEPPPAPGLPVLEPPPPLARGALLPSKLSGAAAIPSPFLPAEVPGL